jgi:phytanoyl-CoA hydroxylase
MKSSTLEASPSAKSSLFSADTEAPKLQGSLSAEQIAQYYQQGYVVVKNLIDPETVKFALDTIDKYIDDYKQHPDRVFWENEGVKNKTLDTMTNEERRVAVRRIHWGAHRDETFMRFGAHKGLVSALISLIGEDFKVLQDMALIKPPKIGSEKPLHQDAAYFEVEPHDQTVGTWWALDRATLENGCMCVWPGTHRMPVIPHKQIENTPHLVIDSSMTENSKMLPVPMEPGDVLLFSSHLFHFTPPNHSEFRRRSLQIHYVSCHCRIAEGKKARPYTLIHGKEQPGCI